LAYIGRNHGAQPFPRVTLLKTGIPGDIEARGWRKPRHDIEQACAMSNGHHQRQRAGVQHPDQPLFERGALCRIDLRIHHHSLSHVELAAS
jgi:hypothetical protein